MESGIAQETPSRSGEAAGGLPDLERAHVTGVRLRRYNCAKFPQPRGGIEGFQGS